ncbi:GNAT family N-acetyltransferase [Maricaulis sp.]|uniref:GNAT family N-acetyltransferase n=1 Tax=Maricaulis sp. TaxID=1486257 RepID=UPI002605AC7B|nr:GNAT family N-acetyltransferase [Maricaulis sp.]
MTEHEHPYASQAYAAALCAMEGRIGFLETLGIWVEINRIPESDAYDARGVYPFSPSLQQTGQETLQDELRALGLVSLVLVTDALEDQPDTLLAAFDVRRSYKEHFTYRPGSVQTEFSANNQRYLRRARRRCQFRDIDLVDHFDEWIALYDHLIRRHGLTGRHQFSHTYMKHLAQSGRFDAIGAFFDGRLIGCQTWLTHNGCAYGHIGASNDEGYRHGAAFGLYGHAIEKYAGCRELDLGGAPDRERVPGGLSSFKSGFANGRRSNFLLGSIADPSQYDALCRLHKATPRQEGFFPAYRGPATLS